MRLATQVRANNQYLFYHVTNLNQLTKFQNQKLNGLRMATKFIRMIVLVLTLNQMDFFGSPLPISLLMMLANTRVEFSINMVTILAMLILYMTVREIHFRQRTFQELTSHNFFQHSSRGTRNRLVTNTANMINIRKLVLPLHYLIVQIFVA